MIILIEEIIELDLWFYWKFLIFLMDVVYPVNCALIAGWHADLFKLGYLFLLFFFRVKLLQLFPQFICLLFLIQSLSFLYIFIFLIYLLQIFLIFLRFFSLLLINFFTIFNILQNSLLYLLLDSRSLSSIDLLFKAKYAQLIFLLFNIVIYYIFLFWD